MGNNRYYGGRGRGVRNNNRFQNTFQGQNNGSRGRQFSHPHQQQHFQENFHVNHPTDYVPPNDGYYQENYYQAEGNGQENEQAGAEEHSAELHTDGISGARELNAKEHYSYDQYLQEHYGYEEPELNYDDIYGAKGDY